jgi:hypothetical protein
MATSAKPSALVSDTPCALPRSPTVNGHAADAAPNAVAPLMRTRQKKRRRGSGSGSAAVPALAAASSVRTTVAQARSRQTSMRTPTVLGGAIQRNRGVSPTTASTRGDTGRGAPSGTQRAPSATRPGVQVNVHRPALQAAPDPPGGAAQVVTTVPLPSRLHVRRRVPSTHTRSPGGQTAVTQAPRRHACPVPHVRAVSLRPSALQVRSAPDASQRTAPGSQSCGAHWPRAHPCPRAQRSLTHAAPFVHTRRTSGPSQVAPPRGQASPRQYESLQTSPTRQTLSREERPSPLHTRTVSAFKQRDCPGVHTFGRHTPSSHDCPVGHAVRV